MPTQVTVLWTYLRARCRVSGEWNESGTVVEKVILTAIFAALAIAVGAIIVVKVTAKANSINLN
jgi:cell division protein FtsL